LFITKTNSQTTSSVAHCDWLKSLAVKVLEIWSWRKFWIMKRKRRFHVTDAWRVAPWPSDRFGISCQQLVTTLLILSDLLRGCSNKSDTVMI
jgi:hypothetical protein